MSHADILDKLGGCRAIADALGMAPNAVINWRTRGIPWKKRHAIARMAADKRIPLPSDFLGA